MALPPHTLLPCCPLYPGACHTFLLKLLWAMMQRGGHEWARQITEIIGNEQLEAHFHDGAESTTGHS